MENIRLKLIEFFDQHEKEIHLPLIEDIADLLYEYYGGVQEKLWSCQEALAHSRREALELHQANSELQSLLVDTVLNYQDAVTLSLQQARTELEYKEKEIRELKVRE